MPELTGAARGGGMHAPRNVRRWRCAVCGVRGTGGDVALTAHYDDAHPTPQRVSAVPPCPVCGATGRRCRRPSGHDADTWHVEREDAMAALVADECPGCAWWLAERAAGRTPDTTGDVPPHNPAAHMAVAK